MDAQAQIAQLTGADDGGKGIFDEVDEHDDVASPELSSMRLGREKCHEEIRQPDFAEAASSPNTSFNSCADMSQEL